MFPLTDQMYIIQRFSIKYQIEAEMFLLGFNVWVCLKRSGTKQVRLNMSFFFNTVLTFYKTTRCQQVSGGPELKHLETTFRSDRCPSGPSWLLGNFLSRGGFQLEVMLV